MGRDISQGRALVEDQNQDSSGMVTGWRAARLSRLALFGDGLNLERSWEGERRQWRSTGGLELRNHRLRDGL